MRTFAALAATLALATPARAQDAPPAKPGSDAPPAGEAAAPMAEPAAAPTAAHAAAPMVPAGAACKWCGHQHKGEGPWSTLTLSPGLQMWRAVGALDDGSVTDTNLIGLVLKAQMTVNDMVAVHLRGAWGMNKTETPLNTRDASAFMVGAGLDMYFNLGRHVIWYNTMGLGFEQASLQDKGMAKVKTNNPGAYFVTTLDISMTDSVGMWMDWGCGVVGPAFADTSAGDVKTWHINPLGAGGFRFSF